MTKRRRVIAGFCGLGGALALAATTCSGTAILNRASSDEVYVLESGIAYGDEPRQVLDVYRPRAESGSAPVVVFFYGGGWEEGDRRDFEFVASSLSREGLVVVLPDYRVYPEVTHPAFCEDAARAVAWVQREIGAHGGDPGRICVAGHSAGAHLAAMVALDGALLEAAGGDAGALRGFVGIAGPYDFLPFDEGDVLERIFPQPVRIASQPVHHIAPDGGAPLPMLLLHGTADERVRPHNSKSLAALAEAAGGDVTLTLYEGIGHRRIVAALAPVLDFAAPTRDDVLAWLDALLAAD